MLTLSKSEEPALWVHSGLYCYVLGLFSCIWDFALKMSEELGKEIDVSWLKSALNKVNNDTLITDIDSIEYGNAAPNGINYTSFVTRAIAKVRLASGKNLRRKLIVKKKHRDEVMVVIKSMDVFKSEIKAYTLVLPAMENIMNTIEDSREKFWCDFYGNISEHTILLEDLLASGYQAPDRIKMLDLEHGVFALRTLGRMHALSKILLERKLIHREDFAPFFMADRDSLALPLFGTGLRKLSSAIELAWGSDWQEIKDKLLHQANKVGELMDLYKESKDTFNVICHGDLWTGNMLFKYTEYGNTPIHVKFIDFQCPYVGSYIWDVVYFLYNSIVPSCRRENLRTFYEAYQQSLFDNLRFYGWTGVVPSIEEVLKEADRVAFAVFLILSVILPLRNTPREDAFDLGQMLNPDPSSAVNLNCYADKKCMEDIGDDLIDLAKRGII